MRRHCGPSPPIVLLVADHEDSLAMYAFGLLAMGFQPLMAGNADDGFTRACEFQPDVVVADVMLPGASSFDLTRRLRDDARTHDIGIIVLTRHGDPALDGQPLATGCDRVIVTPCLPDALAAEITAVLVQRHHPVTITATSGTPPGRPSAPGRAPA